MSDSPSLFDAAPNQHLVQDAPRTSDPHPDSVPLSTTIEPEVVGDMPDPADEHLPAVRPEYVPAVVPEAVKRTEEIGGLVRDAVARGIDAASLEKLLDQQFRIMKFQAEQEFDAAMALFRSECPKIRKLTRASVKDRETGVEKYSYFYADLENVERSIKPLCEKYGFTYSFKQVYASGVATVTCIVKHRGGHQVETPFAAPIDDKAPMNSMQKSAAVTTFGRRYALVLAFGLPIGFDTDGAYPPDPPETKRDESQPKSKPRNERPQRQEPTTKPAITKDEMSALFKDWSAVLADGKGTTEQFIKWTAKKLEPPPALSPTDTASWRTVLTRPQFDALRKELP